MSTLAPLDDIRSKPSKSNDIVWDPFPPHRDPVSPDQLERPPSAALSDEALNQAGCASNNRRLANTPETLQVTTIKHISVSRNPEGGAKCPVLSTATKPSVGSIAIASQSHAMDCRRVATNTTCGHQSATTGNSTCMWGARSVIPRQDVEVSPTVTNHMLKEAKWRFGRPLISMTDPVLANPEKGWPASYISP